MRHSPSIFVVTAALGLLYASTSTAASFYVNKYHLQNAATACTLSIPTTDTKARPKATGFRNEGTSNVFVICGFDWTGTGSDYSNGYIDIQAIFASFDGLAHDFDCTAMGRNPSSPTGQYQTVAVSIPATGSNAVVFSNTDPNYDLTQWSQSITCLLPPGVAVLALNSNIYDDIGSTP